MIEKPILPAHYARRTVSDIAPDDIYYPKQKIIEMDDVTREVFLGKYAPLKESSKTPKSILGRIGLMRVLGMNDDGSDLSGIVIDARHANFNKIETDFFYPVTPIDEAQADACEELRINSIRPLALVALDEDMHMIYSGSDAAKSYVDYLVAHTDTLHERLRANSNIE